jgi:hypothetical protein
MTHAADLTAYSLIACFQAPDTDGGRYVDHTRRAVLPTQQAVAGHLRHFGFQPDGEWLSFPGSEKLLPPC